MPRSAESIRQWKILRHLEASRHGETVRALAREHDVTERTIWRDMEALQAAGFPLTNEKPDGKTRWKLLSNGLKGLQDSGLSMSELASLYFSRALVQCLAGTPFQEDARSAMDKVASALPPRMRAFLDRLPAVLNVKATPGKKREETRYRKHIADLLNAVLERRQVKMQYYSASSRRTKEYLVEPYRLAFAQGGMYLLAQVPKYRQLRTFAVERIKSLSVTSQTFDVPEGAPTDPFPNSLGVHTGTPERIEIDFLPEAAVHIRERTWHASQQIREKPDGSIRLSLNVCNDWSLRSWILSFGPLARVVSPSSLAESILEQLEEARDGYAPQLDFEFSGTLFDLSDHPRLPFRT
ncbi:MAG: transcriptional regulator [Acidobacteria bacterium]|nr:MAG: transcriptional regulator [Acidobacteriota bacterium]